MCTDRSAVSTSAKIRGKKFTPSTHGSIDAAVDHAKSRAASCGRLPPRAANAAVAASAPVEVTASADGGQLGRRVTPRTCLKARNTGTPTKAAIATPLRALRGGVIVLVSRRMCDDVTRRRGRSGSRAGEQQGRRSTRLPVTSLTAPGSRSSGHPFPSDRPQSCRRAQSEDGRVGVASPHPDRTNPRPEPNHPLCTRPGLPLSATFGAWRSGQPRRTQPRTESFRRRTGDHPPCVWRTGCRWSRRSSASRGSAPDCSTDRGSRTRSRAATASPDARRGAGRLRQDDRGARVVREPGRGAGVGHARRRRQRSGSAVAVRRDGGRSGAAGARARRALQRLGVAGSADRGRGRRAHERRSPRSASRLLLVLDDLHAVTDRDCLASIDHRARAPAAERARGRRHAGRSGAQARDGCAPPARSPSCGRASSRSRPPRRTSCSSVAGSSSSSAEEIELLVERTEGWPAALVLARPLAADGRRPGRAVREFGGDQRFVAEYLSSEVLASLDEDAAVVPARAAVLGEFTAELCDAVLDRTDSAARARRARAHEPLRLAARARRLVPHPLRCSPSTPGPSSPSSEPGAAATDPSTRRRVAQIARAARSRRSSTPRPPATTSSSPSCSPSTTCADQERRRPDASALGSDAAGRPAASSTRSSRSAAATAAVIVGTRARSSSAGCCSSPSGREPSSRSAVDAVRRVRRRDWCARSRVDGGVGQAVRRRPPRRRARARRAPTRSSRAPSPATRARSSSPATSTRRGPRRSRALEHPEIGARPPSLMRSPARRSRSSPPSADGSPRRDATPRRRRRVVGRIGSSRSWLGANASAALGSCSPPRESSPRQSASSASAERFFRDEVATVHHTWLLVLLAACPLRRGRLDEAQATLRAARERARRARGQRDRAAALAPRSSESSDGTRPAQPSGELLEAPSEAELAVLRLLASDLSAREIGEQLFLSPNTIRSHIRSDLPEARRPLPRRRGRARDSARPARATAITQVNRAPPRGCPTPRKARQAV